MLARVLRKALRALSPCLNGGTLPIHDCVHFDDGALWAGNGVATIQVELDVHDVGASIPQKTLKAALRSFSSDTEITIDSTADGLTLASKLGITTLPCVSRSDLAARGSYGSTVAEAKVDAEFARAFAGVSVAASTNESRPVLTGVLMELSTEAVGLTSTDGYRLHHVDLEASVDGDATAICPVGYTKALPTTEPVAVRVSESHVCFTAGGVTVEVRSIEGEYPRYRQLIPSETAHRATFDPAEGTVMATLETFERLADKQRGPSIVVLEFVPGATTAQACLRLSDGGRHEARLPLQEYRGQVLRMAFNPAFLRDAVAFAGSNMAMADGLRAAVLSSARRYALLMPVRL